MADTNIQYYTDTRAVYSTSNEDSKIAIGSATGTVEGLELEYDILTTQKNFKISKLGVNFDDGVVNNTTSLSRIAEVQNLLQAVETPPNATTLQLNNTLLLTDGTNTTSFDINGVDMDVITSGGGHFNFNTLPECSVVPTTANQLTNKTYVDGKSAATANITSTNTNSLFYPVFVSGNGTGITLRCDDVTGPFSINPNLGTMSFANTIGISGAPTNGFVRIGYNAGLTPGAGVNNIAIGLNSATSNQGNNAVAIGSIAGQTTQGAAAVALGIGAGNSNQAGNCVAVGSQAGTTTQGSQSVAIGLNAGNNLQGATAVAVGTSAGQTTQGINSVAIGNNAGNNNQATNSVAIGSQAGTTSQSAQSVAVGNNAGNSNQSTNCVAVGQYAGSSTQGSSSVAVGSYAGNNLQSANSVAVGNNAGRITQGGTAVAIGNAAGYTSQGTGAIAIGSGAGEGLTTGMGANSIAIGQFAGRNSQIANSICINASGVEINPANAGAYVRPIRSEAGTLFNANKKNLQYNTNNYELTYVDYVITPNTSAGLDITGDAALLSGTAGGVATSFLVIKVNGVSYKIALLNP